MQCDDHLLPLLRYVERKPLSAGLVERAELWRWSSLWSRAHGEKVVKALLSPRPVERPTNLTVRVNSPLTAKQLDRVRVSLARGRPYGADDWVMQTVSQLGLQHTFRPEGRPRKASQAADGMANLRQVSAGNAKRKRTESRPGPGSPDR
ncbi:MAG: hypothetical protein ACLQIB_20540 [Isosphaeraceae bacterium]